MWRLTFLFVFMTLSTAVDAFAVAPRSARSCHWGIIHERDRNRDRHRDRYRWNKRSNHHGVIVITTRSTTDIFTSSSSEEDLNFSQPEIVEKIIILDGNDGDGDGDDDDHLNQALDDPKSLDISSNNNVSNRPYLQVAQDEIVGIGGKRGYTYDVNKLKLNLVQKSVRQFKQELLSLLISSTTTSSSSKSSRSSGAKGYINNNHNNNHKKIKSIQQRMKIEEKLAALISANPVATTTDSNLLEGTWELAFATENAVEILDEARFVYSRKKQVSSAAGLGSEERKQVVMDEKNGGGGGGDDVGQGWKLANANQGGKLENPLHTVKRSIYLEDLDQDEDPFMVDSVSLFRGLWTVKRFYKIIGLTRTNLELVPWKKIISFCGREIYATTVEKENGITMNVQFIYLDSDICISMTAGNANNLQVYTKNEEWIESRRQKKHIIQTTLAWLNGFGTPLKLRKKVLSIMGQGGKDIDDYSDSVRRDMEDGQLGKLSEEEYQILLRIVYDDRVSKLIALRLGDYGDDSKDDDSAWGGKDDPFVHLTADERQSIMKQMSIGEIKKAGYIQRKFAEKNKRRRSRMQPFKRPSYEEGQA